jgi:phospholipid-translocating ATPase
MVKSFNGLVGYYRNHIPNLADLLYPLTELTKKGQPNTIEWKAEHEHAFSTLKQKLVSKPILQLPNFEKGFVVQVDASGYGLGAALLQYHKGELLPVAYASRKLLPRELSYATIEKECLAVVYAVQKFKNYLYGKEFVLQTDHRPLIYINHNKSNNDRIMRWSLLLQPYAMKIESISGRENVIADYLSRAEAD